MRRIIWLILLLLVVLLGMEFGLAWLAISKNRPYDVIQSNTGSTIMLSSVAGAATGQVQPVQTAYTEVGAASAPAPGTTSG